MKYQNIQERKYSSKKFNIGTLNHAAQKYRKKLKWSNKWQIVYDRKQKKYQIVSKKISPTEYVVYTVLNTGANMGLGIAAIMITHSILELYIKLAADQAKIAYINEWNKSGKNILILQGYNHKHLKYIEREAKFVSPGIHAVSHSGIMLVLSVLGRKEEIEDIFDGLSYIR